MVIVSSQHREETDAIHINFSVNAIKIFLSSRIASDFIR